MVNLQGGYMYNAIILGMMQFNTPRLFNTLMKQKWYQESHLSWLNSLNNKNKSVLELGCGPGVLLSHIAQSATDVIGIDKSKKMIDFFKAKKSYSNISLKVGDALSNEIYNDRKFNLIIGASIINVVNEPHLLILNAINHLDENGTVSFFFPTPEMTIAAVDEFSLRENITDFSLALLQTWARMARKLTPMHVKNFFPVEYQDRIEFNFYLNGMAADVRLNLNQ